MRVPVCRFGAALILAKCGAHAAAITSGSGTVKVNGDGIGRVGHGISACTTVAAGSKNVFADTH